MSSTNRRSRWRKIYGIEKCDFSIAIASLHINKRNNSWAVAKMCIVTFILVTCGNNAHILKVRQNGRVSQ